MRMKNKQMTTMVAAYEAGYSIDEQLKEVLAHFTKTVLATLLGSIAVGHPFADSDLDIAVAAKQELTKQEKAYLISALVYCTGSAAGLIGLSYQARLLAKRRMACVGI